MPARQRTPPDQSRICEIYIDESSQTKHRYLVIGGVIIRRDDLEKIESQIAALRRPELPHGEMKWTKVSTAKLEAYRRVIDGFFDMPEFSDVHFHSLVVDTHGIDNVRYNSGSSEIGFNKEVYQLASKFARLYPKPLFHLYPDYRETTQSPEGLREILNAGRRKKGDHRDFPFRRCQFRDSKQTPLLQIVDILTGAVAFCVNDHGAKEGASASKKDICQHILKRAYVSNCKRDTNMTGKFTIWHRQLLPRAASPKDRTD